MNLKLSQASKGLTAGIVIAAIASAALGCGGGQSATEGDLPAPPCAQTDILIRGHIQELGAGCVGVEVDEVLGGAASVMSSDGTVLLESDLVTGEAIRGRLGQVYSYARGLSVGDEVAILAGTWGGMLNFEVMPIVDGSVRIQWAGREFDATSPSLLAPDCAEQVGTLRKNGTRVSAEGSGDDSVATAPADPVPNCSAP